ncbi:MAG: DUF1631 domain-containing protein [Cellvibrionaceae bacterium]
MSDSDKSAAKVVPIHNNTSGVGHLPSMVLRLSEKAHNTLLPMLRSVFDKADDSLFELADKSTSNNDQNLYFEAMREIRVRRRAMEQAFTGNLQKSFQQQSLVGAQSGAVDLISSDELSLVQHEDLEEMVAADAMVNKAAEKHEAAIEGLRVRIEQLVGCKVSRQQHPISPRAICDAFLDATREMPVDIKAKLVFYKLFDKLVISNLDGFYQTLNQLLIDQGILPDLVIGRKQNTNRVKSSPPQTSDVAVGENTSTVSSNENVEAGNAVFGELQGLLHPAAGTMGSGGAVSRDQLLTNLSQLQMALPTQPSSGPASPLDVRGVLQEKGVQVAKVDDDVINLVSMLFGFIFDDQNLATPIKQLLGRLQLPLIRVALADKGFFDKDGHPARRLLNEMANMALGWEKEEDLAEDKFYQTVQGVVESIASHEGEDAEFYTQQLNDLMAFSTREQRRAQVMERRLLDAERGKAQSQEARNVVNIEIEGVLLDATLPEDGESILREAWANVMFLQYLREGPESKAWESTIKTARELVVSLQPPQNREERQKLIKLIPGLLKQLRTGLEEISFNPFDMKELFEKLEKLHLTNLRAPLPEKAPVAEKVTSIEQATPDVERGSVQKAKVAESKIVVKSTVEANTQETVDKAVADEAKETANEATSQKPENTIPEPVAEELENAAVVASSEAAYEDALGVIADSDLSRYRNLASQLTVGTWLQMEDAGGNPIRCRLAAYIKPTKKYIFVNRAGVKVAETSLDELAEALAEGSMSVMDDSQLFDRALESVIGDLRQQRGI